MKRLLILMAFLPIGSSAQDAPVGVMYDSTTPSSIDSFANFDAGVIHLDDVLVPVGRLNGATRLKVMQFEVQLFAPVAGNIRVDSFWAKAGAGINASLSQNVQIGANAKKKLTFGDGVNTLFEVPLTMVTFKGKDYGGFLMGLRFNASLNRVGWVTADGPDVSANTFFAFYGNNDPRNGFKSLTGVPGTFYLKIWGEPVPEPVSAAVTGSLLALLLLRRRRK